MSALGGLLGALGALFASLFSTSFLTSMFHRFFLDLVHEQFLPCLCSLPSPLLKFVNKKMQRPVAARWFFVEFLRKTWISA